LLNRQSRSRRNNAREFALMCGIKMEDDDDGCADFLGQRSEEILKRSYPSS
jgi:hypothetical protein